MPPFFISSRVRQKGSEDCTDCHRHTECCSDTEDAVFHYGRGYVLRDRRTGGGGVQRWDLLLEGAVAFWPYAEPVAHAAGFIERNIFEFDGTGWLGHGLRLLRLCAR
jgi:hypothetical protein